MEQKKLYIKTFGCQMNEHDSAKMAMLFANDGYLPTDNPMEADVILLNTCTIREKSHHKAISEIGRALKLKGKRPHLIVGVTGCVAQEEKSRLFEICPDLDLVIGPDQISRLPEVVKFVSSSRSGGYPTSFQSTELINDYDHYRFVSDAKLQGRAVTQYVTVMKGCNNFCSFCIVPFVRGREVSKSPGEIVGEVKKLCAQGVLEITLLGQNVNSYGHDRKEFGKFPDLLRMIAGQTDIARVRYTSPHPKDLSDRLIEEHCTNKVLCEHIHLPVQAGSTGVLGRMNRNYTREDYIERISAIRKALPDIAITTDIIVGFPGERDPDFEETLNLMKEVEFDGMYAFKYSARPGTKAAEIYQDDVPADVKSRRLARVLELNRKIVLKKHEKYVGTIQEVLVEGLSKRGEDQLTGRTRTNKVVNLEGDMNLVGKLVHVCITDAGVNSLRGSYDADRNEGDRINN